MPMPLDPVSVDLMRRLQNKILKNTILPKLLRVQFRRSSKNAAKADGTLDKANPAPSTYCDAGTQTVTETTLEDASQTSTDIEQPEQLEQAAEVEEVAWTDQELRYQRTVQFRGEDASDYTWGPSRMVNTSDGVNECVALLMKLELSKRIQKAMHIQRQYEREERHAAAQMEEIDKLRRTVDDEMRAYQMRELEARQRGNEGEISQVVYAQYILAQMQEEVPGRKARYENRMYHLRGELRSAQSAVIAYLEDALVAARLVEPNVEEEMAVEYFDIQEEYQKACKEEVTNAEPEDVDCEAHASSPPQQQQQHQSHPLETGTDFMHQHMNSPTPSQQALSTLRTAYARAQHRASEAQTEFDRKESLREQERIYCAHQMMRGEPAPYATEEDFDVKWVQNFRDITHELVEAERELGEIRKLARESKVELEGDYDVEDYGENHSDVSFEVDAPAAAMRVGPGVEVWMNGVPEDAVEDVMELVEEDDEWDARDVEVWDSLSCLAVDEESYAGQIAEWQQACQETREAQSSLGAAEKDSK